MHFTRSYLHGGIGRPIPHLKVVRDNAGPRIELLEQKGAEFAIHAWQEIKRYNRGLAEVGLK